MNVSVNLRPTSIWMIFKRNYTACHSTVNSIYKVSYNRIIVLIIHRDTTKSHKGHFWGKILWTAALKVAWLNFDILERAVCCQNVTIRLDLYKGELFNFIINQPKIMTLDFFLVNITLEFWTKKGLSNVRIRPTWTNEILLDRDQKVLVYAFLHSFWFREFAFWNIYMQRMTWHAF